MKKTSKEIVEYLNAVKSRLVVEVSQSEMQSMREAKLIAIRDFSSGGFKTAILRRMGHPYSKRNPRPPANPAIMNRQTGLFRSSWQIHISSDVSSQNIKSKLVNTAPYAGYVVGGGNSRMMFRPIKKYIKDKVEPIRSRNLQYAIDEALKG